MHCAQSYQNRTEKMSMVEWLMNAYSAEEVRAPTCSAQDRLEVSELISRGGEKTMREMRKVLWKRKPLCECFTLHKIS